MNEFDEMKRLLEAGRLKLGVAIRPMNQAGSPVWDPWQTLTAPALVLSSSLLATIAVHYYLGFAVIIVGCWWWLAKVQPKISEQIYERTCALVLNDIRAFDLYWAKGVLSLIHTAPDGAQQVACRKDDWRAFIRLVTAADTTGIAEVTTPA